MFEKGLELRISVRRKYRNDASANSGQVALTITAQCALPVNLVHLEGMEEESFLDQIDSKLLMLVSSHNDMCRRVKESRELVTILTEDLKAEQAKVEKFPDEDWGFVSQIDAYQDLDEEEEAAEDTSALVGDVQNFAQVASSKLEGGPGVLDALESTALTSSSVFMEEPMLSVGIFEDYPCHNPKPWVGPALGPR
ncbi:hypothetical protein JCGZ_05165 [Jatropha curcas]|uniref:Uncharacterized protein n=1 Tax=Jatropha curcas TaxID=180498 RepID=A0A067L2H5_JATCU|nr:hypothetical protein JCGZ_05165 [Jatropha curcas]